MSGQSLRWPHVFVNRVGLASGCLCWKQGVHHGDVSQRHPCVASVLLQVHAPRDRNRLDYKGLVFYFDTIHPDGVTGHRWGWGHAASSCSYTTRQHRAWQGFSKGSQHTPGFGPLSDSTTQAV